MKFAFLVLCAVLCFPQDAHAYLDPGSGSVLLSTVLAILSAFIYSFKSLYYRIFSSQTGEPFDLNEETIVLFNEGKTYWGTFRPLINELIKQEVHFRYITMDLHDPALKISNKYMHSRLYPKGHWAYAKIGKIKTPLMLSTTPNIGSEGYPLKKSPFIQELVHVFHAMSGTANYHLGALDFYDSVIMVGEHQKDELRKIEEARGIKKKNLIALGLPYLDDLLHQMPKDSLNAKSPKTTILIAPSWGAKGCFSYYDLKFIEELADHDFEIIIRLHPQSYIAEPDKVNLWQKRLDGIKNIRWDQEMFAHNAMDASDILISDTSCIRFDYAFLYLKPVITLSIPQENRNSYESKYLEETWSELSSSVIGKVITVETIDQLPHLISETIDENQRSDIERLRQNTMVNLGESAEHIVNYLKSRVSKNISVGVASHV